MKRGKEGQNVCPLRFVFRESKESAGDKRPAAEASFEGADVIFAFTTIGAARRRGVHFSGNFTPITEELKVFGRNVAGLRIEAGGFGCFTP